MFFAPSMANRVLIVDDDPTIVFMLEHTLLHKGYHVTVAEDGEQAAFHIQNASSFDLILLDVMLPGKSGWDVLQEIQSAWGRVPVMMMSTEGQQENILKAFSLGATDFVVKPFYTEEVAARIRAVLQRTLIF